MNPSKQVKAHVLEYGSLSNISVAMLKLFPFSAGVMLQIVYLAQFVSLVGVFHTRKSTHRMFKNIRSNVKFFSTFCKCYVTDISGSDYKPG